MPLQGLPSAPCNASGHTCFTLTCSICSTLACAVPGGVCPTAAFVAPRCVCLPTVHLDCAVYKSLCCTCYVYCMSTRALCCCTWIFLSIRWTWSCFVHKILCLFVSKPFYVCFGCFDTGSKHRNIPRNCVLVSWNKPKNNRNRLRFGSFRFFQF